MPIEEKAINGILADVLKRKYKVHAMPEFSIRSRGLKRPDISVYEKMGDRYFTAIECKIGQDINAQKRAVKSAERWIDEPDCWNVVALCYPQEFSKETSESLSHQVVNSTKLLMLKINRKGSSGRFYEGGISDLIELSNSIDEETKNTRLIIDLLEKGITKAADMVSVEMSDVMADNLELPKLNKKDRRPSLIGCLILANTLLLQNRLKESNVRIEGGIKSLLELKDSRKLQLDLLDNWKKIRRKNYAPVIDPAISLTKKLVTTSRTDELMRVLLKAVLECASLIRKVQTDHIGPLYHGLLETARYDGSFYTSTSASVLLSELAITPEWFDTIIQSDINKVPQIKICDPACGTGTLLMASARSITKRVEEIDRNINQIQRESLHLNLVENVLYGFDINRHAIHLSASMLTMSAPKIDYNKLNLYRMHHGVDNNGQVRAGSLDILIGSSIFNSSYDLKQRDTRQVKTVASGYVSESIDLDGKCDLVIMNPPFTRDSIRNDHLGKKIEDQVKKREREIQNDIENQLRKNAINRNTVFSYFPPIADQLLNAEGTLAIVQPFAANTGIAAQGYRQLITNTALFHLEIVVTSHDNSRINFSENTTITESLVVARRPRKNDQKRKTAFVSLIKNPSATDVFEAKQLANSIKEALAGNENPLKSRFGSIWWKDLKESSPKPWNETVFYHQPLAEIYDQISEKSGLTTLKSIANILGVREVRGTFEKVEGSPSPYLKALWYNKSGRETKLKTLPDTYLLPKKRKKEKGDKIWAKRGNLLLPEKMRLNLARTTARFTEDPVISPTYNTVFEFPFFSDKDFTVFCKAFCCWFNSTYGVLGFLNIRSRTLDYPIFTKGHIESLPVPDPKKCDLNVLAEIFEKIQDKDLKPFPQINEDAIRAEIDDAVQEILPQLPDAKELREFISMEPSVHQRKE